MGRYVVIYHAPASAAGTGWDQMKDATPEDMQKGMEAWMAWAQRCGEGLVDMGAPLGGSLKLTSSGSSPSDRRVAGYSILEADSMEGALALLREHPHLEWASGCEIEVHEAQSPPG